MSNSFKGLKHLLMESTGKMSVSHAGWLCGDMLRGKILNLKTVIFRANNHFVTKSHDLINQRKSCTDVDSMTEYEQGSGSVVTQVPVLSWERHANKNKYWIPMVVYIYNSHQILTHTVVTQAAMGGARKSEHFTSEAVFELHHLLVDEDLLGSRRRAIWRWSWGILK